MNAQGYVLAATGALTVAALAALLADGLAANLDRSQAIEFQRLTRGLGLGAETHLGRCALAMDPRLDGQCWHVAWPLAGGEYLCPCHAWSILPIAPAPAEVRLLFSRRADGPPD